ncbi:MAG: hypothetical protein AABM66_12170 [Actinomycetota bacterium]
MSRQRHPSVTFEALSDDVLEAIRAGCSAADAAFDAGCSARTIERWVARGRSAPDGPYGEFAAAVDELRAERALPTPAEREAMDAEELLRVASGIARRGNVQALRLVWEILRARKARGQAEPDTLAALDELAARRGRRAGP